MKVGLVCRVSPTGRRHAMTRSGLVQAGFQSCRAFDLACLSPQLEGGPVEWAVCGLVVAGSAMAGSGGSQRGKSDLDVTPERLL